MLLGHQNHLRAQEGVEGWALLLSPGEVCSRQTQQQLPQGDGQTDTRPCSTRRPCPASPLATAMVALSCREVLKDSKPKTFCSVFRTLPSRPGGAFPLILRALPTATETSARQERCHPAVPEPLHDLPATFPLFSGLSGMSIQTPLTGEGHSVYSGSVPSSRGTAQRAGGPQCAPNRPAPDMEGAVGAPSHPPPSSPGPRVPSVSPVPPPCPLCPLRVPRPTSARSGPRPPLPPHTRQVLSRRHKMTSQAPLKGPTRALFIPSPPATRSAPPR